MKKLGLIISAALFLFSMSVYSYAQLVPVQVEQNQLDRVAPTRDLQNNPQANGIISERQAVNFARQRFAGNILRISLVGEGNNRRYQIRMENQGKVFTVFVHSTTGEVTGGN
ncbi:MAG: hypothetical protein GKR91_14355 [Pseudomonadales bacterium]|nr:hypothetical protein [Pseudomonadales bacterium]